MQKAERGKAKTPFPYTCEVRVITAVCPECRKKFIVTDTWGYVIGSTNYCSWKCTRQAEHRMAEEEGVFEDLAADDWIGKPPPTLRRGGGIYRAKVSQEEIEQIRQYSTSGMTMRQIARKTGFSVSTVYKYTRHETA